MYSKIKKAALILCAAAMLTFSFVGCGSGENSDNSSSAASASSQSSQTDSNSNQTSETSQDPDNYSQEITIDENNENATMPQASDSIDLG